MTHHSNLTVDQAIALLRKPGKIHVEIPMTYDALDWVTVEKSRFIAMLDEGRENYDDVNISISEEDAPHKAFVIMLPWHRSTGGI